MKKPFVLLGLFAAVCCRGAEDFSVKWEEKSIELRKTHRRILLDYPEIMVGKKSLKPQKVLPERDMVQLQYPGGVAGIVRGESGKLVCRFQNAAAVYAVKQYWYIPDASKNGCQYRLSGQEFRDFPATRSAKGTFFKGNSGTLELKTPEGSLLTFELSGARKIPSAFMAANWFRTCGWGFCVGQTARRDTVF